MKSEFTTSNPNLSNPANVFSFDSLIASVDYVDVDTSMGVPHVNVRKGVSNVARAQPAGRSLYSEPSASQRQ